MTTTVKGGLTPHKLRGSLDYTAGRSKYLIKSGSLTTALAAGDPVKVSAGYIQRATRSNTIGVFDGARYIDINTKQPVETNYIAASTVNDGVIDGESDIIAFVYDHPDMTYLVRASTAGSVAKTQLGKEFTVTTGTPSTVFKRSTVTLSVVAPNTQATAAVAATSAGTVLIVGCPDLPGNRWGKAGGIVEVRLTTNKYN